MERAHWITGNKRRCWGWRMTSDAALVLVIWTSLCATGWTQSSNVDVSSNMLTYHKNAAVDTSKWEPFDPTKNGATNISNDFQARWRPDMTMGKIVAGEYVQQPASAVITWPFTEHAFVIEGRVTITDLATGKEATYGPGDGWIIKQGSKTKWDVTQPLRKSFFLVSE